MPPPSIPPTVSPPWPPSWQAILPTGPPSADLAGFTGAIPHALWWAILAGGLAFCAATLRASLRKFSRERVLSRKQTPAARARMEELLDRSRPLGTAARWLEISLKAITLWLLFNASQSHAQETNPWVWLLLLIPAWIFFWSILPNAIALAKSQQILVNVLPAFALVARPFAWITRASDWLQSATYRLLRTEVHESTDGQVLQNLRSALKDRGENDHLDETAQELIKNVLDFRAADAAEVMTPRTEVQAVDVADGLESAMQTILVSGHSRIPVFDETIDSIIGTVTARRVMREMAKPKAERASLDQLLHPPMLVPETKPVAQLLAEFRDVRQKLAVVLDEYGGTAGIVTMSDVVGEIVGDFLEEHEDQTQPIRELDRNLFEVSAGLHVSEVNEALSLDIPEEEDFETLGGYVLARLGHIPQIGETFSLGTTHFAVSEASDRRVIQVQVRPTA